MTASTDHTTPVDRAELVPVAAIWNPASGSAPDEAELKQALGAGVRLIATTEDDPGPGQTRQAVEGGATTVVVCGGDGTIRACIDPLIGTEAALDLVPLGTGNLLAANLGIPSGLDAAAEIARSPRRRIDIGRVNGEAFSVMAGTGFDAVMMRDAEDGNKSRWGVAAYVRAAIGHLRDRLEPTTVIVDGERWFTGRTSMVLVGNHGTMSGGLTIFDDADPTDGRLDVAVLAAHTLREWAGVVARLLAGRPHSSKLVEMTQGREILVLSRRERPYELDGEPRPPTALLRFGIEPQALLVHDHRDQAEAAR